MRKVRNTIVAKLMSGSFIVTTWLFSKFKPYVHTEYLKRFREVTFSMEEDIAGELELRKKINAANRGGESVNSITMVMRDSSVLNGESLKKMKEAAVRENSSSVNKYDQKARPVSKQQELSRTIISQYSGGANDLQSKNLQDRKKQSSNYNSVLERNLKAGDKRLANTSRTAVKKDVIAPSTS